MERLIELADDCDIHGYSLPKAVRDYINKKEEELRKRGVNIKKPAYATTSQYIRMLATA